MNRLHRILLVFLLLAVLPAGARSAPNPEAQVRGEVARPGVYELRGGETLSSLILRAGGYADNAWLPGAVLLRKSEKARQAAELAGIVKRLEAAAREAGPWEPQHDRMRRLAESVRHLVPSGRVPVRLSLLRLMINSPQDIPLEEGDDLFLPSAPQTVRVLGAVRDPGDYPASPGARLPDIAAAAGGLLPEADADGTILLKADGTARRLSEGWVAWNEALGRWEISAFRRDRPRIEAGDTILVPGADGPIGWPGGTDDWRRTILRILVLTGEGAAW